VLLSRAAAVAVASVLIDHRPALAILTGTPTATYGQARFETVPLGVDDQTPKFSHTEDGKLNWETNTIGSGGFGGWPTLGAPTIIQDTGASGVLPVGAVQAATATYGGGMAAMSVASVPGAASVGLGFGNTVSDAGPNGTASITVGAASATWTNSFDQPVSNPLDFLVVMNQIVVLPPGGLLEMGLAGNTGNVTGGGSGTDLSNFYVVAGIDDTGNRHNICYGAVTPGGTSGASGFAVTRIAPMVYLVNAFYHFGQVAFDGESLELNATLTLAMDPAIGSFVRPGPISSMVTPVAAGGAGVYGSEGPGSSTEWSNTAGGSDYNNPGNFSMGAPTSTGEAYLADTGAMTPGGLMISAAGPHALHLLTVANSTSTSAGDYTIGTSPHQGSFSFGIAGGIEVYADGTTVNNCDISASSLLNLRTGGGTTTLSQFGNVSSPQISINGLGTIKFFSPMISFSILQANLGTAEFVAPLTTSGTFAISNGATVQLDGMSSMLSGGTISIAAGGSMKFAASATISDSVSNAGTVEATMGAGSVSFTGSFTNAATGNIQADMGSIIHMIGPSGLSTNPGTITLASGGFDNGGHTLDNTGTISGAGLLSTGGLTNDGTISITGTIGSNINGDVTNSTGKTIGITSPATFTGNVTNNGTIHVTGTTVTFAGRYSGKTYISDPSTNIFQNNVTVVAGGSMTGGAGDAFNMSGGTFTNHGTFTNGGTLQCSDVISNDGTFSQSGTLTQSADFVNSGTVTIGGTQSWSSGTHFNNSAGTATFQSDAGSASSAPLTVNVLGGTVTFAAATQHLASVSVSGATSLAMAAHVPSATSPSVLTINTLSLTAGGTFDLTNNEMLTQSTPPLVQNLLFTGALFTSTAGGAIGYRDVMDGTVEARFTLLGDSDLDGKVNVADLANLAGNFGVTAGAVWLQGDFDYNGSVNVADLADLAGNFGKDLSSAGLSSGDVANPTATGAGDGAAAAVPEPAGAVILVLSGAVALGARRRPWRARRAALGR
jgi:hypothetical protein